MHPAVATLLLLGGIGLLVWTVLQRLGRQWWAREWLRGYEHEMSFQMLFLPGLGLIVTGISVALMGVDTAWEPLTGLLVALCLPVGLVMALWGMFVTKTPLWFLPRWSRDTIRQRRESETVRNRKKWRRRWQKLTGRTSSPRQES